MSSNSILKRLIFCVVFTAFGFEANLAFAQTVLPGSADTGRIKPAELPKAQEDSSVPVQEEQNQAVKAPAGAEQIRFQLNSVIILGVSAFQQAELEPVYAEFMNRTITLDVAWVLADRITKLYRQEGYFLSRAFVPEQSIENGTLIIRVVEGHIGEVGFENVESGHGRIINKLVSGLINKRPLKAEELESFMLRLNDVAPEMYTGILQKLEDGRPGAIKILVKSVEKDKKYSFNLNNYGSRFLGPYQLSAVYREQFIKEQETTLFAAVSIPADELIQGSINHKIPITPDVFWFASASYVSAHPGGRLEDNDIDSVSKEFRSGVVWQPIRQRSENLQVQFDISGLNTDADILGDEPLTRDRVRIIEGKISYDKVDKFGAYNDIGISLRQGVSAFGASDEDDDNLSRAEAEPDFTILGLDYSRQQFVADDLLVIGKASGQIASGPLYSSQEFGYGGYAFGRAYDPSEVLGDHGVSASAEMRYTGFKPYQKLGYVPYVFYDIGKVWNEDEGGDDISAASAGLGIILEYDQKVSADFGLAWPLTKPIDEPQYGDDENPRLLMQINYGF